MIRLFVFALLISVVCIRAWFVEDGWEHLHGSLTADLRDLDDPEAVQSHESREELTRRIDDVNRTFAIEVSFLALVFGASVYGGVRAYRERPSVRRLALPLLAALVLAGLAVTIFAALAASAIHG